MSEMTARNDDSVDEQPEQDWKNNPEGKKIGSFSLEEVKACVEYSRKIETIATKKRKWALNFGYLGSNYQGLQMNPTADTIEKHLEKALYLAGTISKDNFTDLHKIQWTRTARTDRGVHAVMQCCAMKLLIPLDERELFINNVNSFLPQEIKVHAISKVTKNFNSKLQCTKRRYHYLLPTYMLQDKAAILNILNSGMSTQGPSANAASAGGYADHGSDRFLGPGGLNTAMNVLKTFRLEPARLDLFRKALKSYEGTRKYHNFTSDKHPSDANSSRYILSFTCGEPFMYRGSESGTGGADRGSDLGSDSAGSEWVLLSVVGQSFLLNQIRKMIALACEVATGHVGLGVMVEAVTDKKMDIPMAPGVGLYLDELYFDNYNNNQDKAAKLQVQEKADKLKEKGKEIRREKYLKSLEIQKEGEGEGEGEVKEEGENEMNVEGTGEKVGEVEVKGIEKKRDVEGEKAAEDKVQAEVAAVGEESLTSSSSSALIADIIEGDENEGEGDDNEPSLGETIRWTQDASIKATMTGFRQDVIWPHIVKEDKDMLHFMYYMDYLRVSKHNYTTSAFKEKSQAKSNSKDSGGNSGNGGRGGNGGKRGNDRNNKHGKGENGGKGGSKWDPRKKQRVEVAPSSSSSTKIGIKRPS